MHRHALDIGMQRLPDRQDQRGVAQPALRVQRDAPQPALLLADEELPARLIDHAAFRLRGQSHRGDRRGRPGAGAARHPQLQQAPVLVVDEHVEAARRVASGADAVDLVQPGRELGQGAHAAAAVDAEQQHAVTVALRGDGQVPVAAVVAQALPQVDVVDAADRQKLRLAPLQVVDRQAALLVGAQDAAARGLRRMDPDGGIVRGVAAAPHRLGLRRGDRDRDHRAGTRRAGLEPERQILRRQPRRDQRAARALGVGLEGPQAHIGLGDVQRRLVVAHRAALGVRDRRQLAQHLGRHRRGRDLEPARAAQVAPAARAACAACAACAALGRVDGPRGQQPLLRQTIAAQQEGLERLLARLEVEADRLDVDGRRRPLGALAQALVPHLDQAKDAGVGVLQQRDGRAVREPASIPALGAHAELVHRLARGVEQPQAALAQLEHRSCRRCRRCRRARCRSRSRSRLSDWNERARSRNSRRQERADHHPSGAGRPHRLHRHDLPLLQNIASFRLSL